MAALNLDPEWKKLVDKVRADLLSEAKAAERKPKDLGRTLANKVRSLQNTEFIC